MKQKVLLPFFVAVLVASLAMFGAAAPALAAPLAQSDDAGAMEVWASNVYPSADSAGMMEFVVLYPNNAAEVIAIYLDSDLYVETGEWAAGDDGALTLTLTSDAQGDFDEPHVMEFTRSDELLTDGAFEYYPLTVITPEEMEARTAAADAGDEGAASDAATEESFGRVWVSDVLPAADAAGLINVLALFDNGAMEQYAIYLGKSVVTELGAWEEDADHAVTVTVTESLDEVYDEPVVTIYQHAGDTLTDGPFVLTLWPEIITDPSGVYGSDVYVSEDFPEGYTVVLALYEDGTAEQTTVFMTEGAATEVGEWVEEEDHSITVTLTGYLDEEPYAEPVVTTYARNINDDELSDENWTLYLLNEITGEEDAAEAGIVAVFESDTLPAASSPGRILTLTLFDDGAFVLETDYLNDEPVVTEVGDWEINDDETQLTISITGNEEEEYSEPEMLVFEEEGDQIVAVEYDESVWGSEGLTLTLISAE
jgi:hypothetical protein